MVVAEVDYLPRAEQFGRYHAGVKTFARTRGAVIKNKKGFTLPIFFAMLRPPLDRFSPSVQPFTGGVLYYVLSSLGRLKFYFRLLAESPPTNTLGCLS